MCQVNWIICWLPHKWKRTSHTRQSFKWTWKEKWDTRTLTAVHFHSSAFPQNIKNSYQHVLFFKSLSCISILLSVHLPPMKTVIVLHSKSYPALNIFATFLTQTVTSFFSLKKPFPPFFSSLGGSCVLGVFCLWPHLYPLTVKTNLNGFIPSIHKYQI